MSRLPPAFSWLARYSALGPAACVAAWILLPATHAGAGVFLNTMPGRVTSPAIGGHGEGPAEPGEEGARPVGPSDHGHGGGGSSTLASLLIGTLALLPLLGSAGGCDMNDLNVDLQGNMEDHSRMAPMEASPFFENGTSVPALELADVTTWDGGIALMTYRPAAEA